MPDIDDDDELSDAEVEILDDAKHGAMVMIDMNEPIQVERANRLLQRGLIKVVGEHLEDDGPGVWSLIQRVPPGETPPAYEPLEAFSHRNDPSIA